MNYRCAVLGAALGAVLASYASEAAAQSKEWTLLLYLSADRHLEDEAIDDVNGLERGLDPTNTYVVVQLDRTPGYDTSNGDWTTTRRYLLDPDTNSDRVIRSTMLEDLGELNMGDPATLVDFVTWGITAYPSERYLVMVWGSAAPMGIGFDDTSSDGLSIINDELPWAFGQIKDALGRNVDLLVLWGCNIGLFENDFLLREYADVLARSEIATFNMVDEGEDLLAWLAANPTATAAELATALIDTHADFQAANGRSMAWAAFDSSPSHVGLGLAVDTFGRELVMAGGKSQPDISAAVAQTVYGYDVEFDLMHFASNITAEGALPQSLRDAAQDVLDAYGYPPQADHPLLHFRFVQGSTPPPERWWNGDPTELRGLKSAKTMSPGNWQRFADNSAWAWFAAGETTLLAQPLLTYEANSLDDRLVRGADQPLTVTLRNSGGLAATGINATLSTAGPHQAVAEPAVTITTATAAFDDIAAGDSGQSQLPFELSVDPAAPLGKRIWLWLDVTAGGGYRNAATSFCLEVVDGGGGAGGTGGVGPGGSAGSGGGTAANGGAAGDGGSGAAGASVPGAEEDDSGCSCRLVPAHGSGASWPPWAASWLGLGALLVRRARRRLDARRSAHRGRTFR